MDERTVYRLKRDQELASWTEGRPGSFCGRTHDDVWDAAWASFNAGPTGGLANQVKFMTHLQQAGFGIRALTVGGFTLDKVS